MPSPQWVSVLNSFSAEISSYSIADQAETVSRRVEKFADLMQTVWVSKNDFERRMRIVGIISSTLT